MFDHVKFGVSDFAASKAFYLAALEPLGLFVAGEGAPSYGVELCTKTSKISLCLFQTDERPAHLHIAFVAQTRQQVDAFHRAALAAGGQDHGAPGLRPHYHANYYAAFVIGPDGHNIEVVCHAASDACTPAATSSSTNSTTNAGTDFFNASTARSAMPHDPENVVREFWRLMASNDFASVVAVLADDFVLEWPQSKERIRGGANFARMNAEYPSSTGRWSFRINRLIASGESVVTQVSITDGAQSAEPVSFFTVAGGRITRLVEYWPEPCEAPAHRRHLVEPMDPAAGPVGPG